MISQTFNEDCMELMARYPDKHFDLAVVDPPYGIDVVNKTYKNRGGYLNPHEKYPVKKATHAMKEWDNARPSAEYWKELFRVSKNQIVWAQIILPTFCPCRAVGFFGIKMLVDALQRVSLLGHLSLLP